MQEKGKATVETGRLRGEGYEKIGGGRKMERGGRPIENNGKKEQKEWLDNTLPNPHPCTAGNKEEEHMVTKSSHET